jgi:hypothetical protein
MDGEVTSSSDRTRMTSMSPRLRVHPTSGNSHNAAALTAMLRTRGNLLAVKTIFLQARKLIAQFIIPLG